MNSVFSDQRLLTRIPQSCPGIIILPIPSNVQHAVDGRRTSEASATVKVALAIVHRQAGTAVGLGSSKKIKGLLQSTVETQR